MKIENPVHFKHWQEIPASLWRWENFTPDEIACKSDGSIIVNFGALDKLQRARILAKRPLHINSAYRTIEHNRSIGGKPDSVHLQGAAFDISLRNFEKQELYKILLKAGFTGFGLSYDNFIHADTGRKRQW